MASNRFGPLTTVPEPAAESPASAPAPTSNPAGGEQRPQATPRKRKGHRGGKKKRPRRKSFAVLDDDDTHGELESSAGEAFYQLPQANLSGTSIDSEALLDHRAHQPMRVRRASTLATSNPFQRLGASPSTSRLRSTLVADSDREEHPSSPWDESAPLLSPAGGAGYGGTRETRGSRPQSRRASSKSSQQRQLGVPSLDSYDINHPPSVPGSPNFGASNTINVGFGDVMMRDDLELSPRQSVDDGDARPGTGGTLREQRSEHVRRIPPTNGTSDVCFPGPEMSEIGEEDFNSRDPEIQRYRTRRHRRRWPDLSTLEEWQQLEKEGRSDERRVKKITEPQLINGRLRPVRKGWFQTDEEAPFRFTYFNEDFQSTIHSQTISELVQPGGGFRELFIPDPPILSDDESETDEDDLQLQPTLTRLTNTSAGMTNIDSKAPTRQPSVAEARPDEPSPTPRGAGASKSATGSGRGTPAGVKSPEGFNQKAPQMPDPSPAPEKPIRYGDRPIWWLDVLSPTDAEMKVLSKAFGIHPLTAEDIMLQEAREKVELFRHYYFVNYRTFDQDIKSENYLEPVNMYVVVFREGVISFHFSVTPHPANVRRRIRQLKDYLILSSDWISYAIIDDITDVFQPLIQTIEDEVDDIDEGILRFQSLTDKRLKDDKTTNADDATTVFDSSTDMLRRVGDCRKRVMSLYRLLGNKADVIKGFAKRCNERWEVAPRSEIGLYLGDIQDHIVTMTSNLGHYEKILARSHANYLAQINIRMNERSEQTADVLGKLTVLGTIVLPMNIITGLWGMNVWVPGQDVEHDLAWFWCITACLCIFGLACYMIAKRVYKIV